MTDQTLTDQSDPPQEEIGRDDATLAPAAGTPPDVPEPVDDTGTSPYPTLGAPASTHFVYALGRLEPRFPTLAVEKEFAQVVGRGDTAGLTDRETLRSLLAERANRYLLRKLCWVFSVQGVETYLLHPRDPLGFDQLLEALRPAPRPTDVDVAIGLLGPVAPPDFCNGLMVPIVALDQLYCFDVDSLLGSIPRPKGLKAEQFEPAAEELLSRIMQMSDNAGASDADRALNYLLVRYPAIYHLAADRFAADTALTSVEVRNSSLSGARAIVDVIFAYTDRKTDVTEKHFVRVDVTEEFPFLVSKLSPYFDRDL